MTTELIKNPIGLELTQVLENEPLYKQIVQKIEDGTFPLSFTKISNFLDCPKAFMQYCMRTQERTKAMKYGSMIHHYLLEKDTFESSYKVAPECNLTTIVGKNDYLEFLGNMLNSDEFDEFLRKFETEQEEANSKRLLNFKPTKAKPEVEFKNVWDYKDLQEYVELTKNIEIVRHQDMYKATKQADAIKMDYDFRKYIHPKIEYTEKLVKNENIDGYRFTGKIDLGGLGFKADIKTVTDATPQAIARQILKEYRHVQGLIYNKIDGNLEDDFFNVSVDGDFQVSVVRMSSLTMLNAEFVYQKFLTGFERCLMQRGWWESYSFWNEHGIFEV